MSEKIIGQRFGMLVVQSEIEPVRDARGHLVRMFNCLCDCGKEKVFRYNNLISGLVNSCGCTRIPKDPRVDLSGRRFGHLTVLFEAEPHYEKCGKKIRCWACLCDCGNETVIFQSNLVSQHGTRSCGCALKYGGRPVKFTVNLTGNRYGRLVVIAPADPAGRPGGSHRYRWLCRCDCGNETIVAGDNLTSGHTQSCGCLKKDKLKKKHFGRLTVISKPIPGKHLWTCRCVCGNEIVVSQDDLFWGSVTSCGCQEKGVPKTDLTGQRFGRLTVVRETEPIKASSGKPVRRWLCRGDCGREVVVRQNNLLHKITRSCGCLRANQKQA